MLPVERQIGGIQDLWAEAEHARESFSERNKILLTNDDIKISVFRFAWSIDLPEGSARGFFFLKLLFKLGGYDCWRSSIGRAADL